MQGKSGHKPQWLWFFASQHDLTGHSSPQKGFEMTIQPLQFIFLRNLHGPQSTPHLDSIISGSPKFWQSPQLNEAREYHNPTARASRNQTEKSSSQASDKSLEIKGFPAQPGFPELSVFFPGGRVPNLSGLFLRGRVSQSA